MVLSSAKSKTMLVTGRRLAKKLDNSFRLLSVCMDGKEIEQVSHQKFLGVTLDCELTFFKHIDKLSSNLAKRIGLLKKLISYLPLDEGVAFYNAAIKSVMMYGNCMWSNTTKNNLDQISKLQKRAACAILGASTRDRSIPLFSKLGWIPFVKEVKIRKAMMICHNRFYGNWPSYVIDILPTNASRDNRITRYSNPTIFLPRIKRQNDGGIIKCDRQSLLEQSAA